MLKPPPSRDLAGPSIARALREARAIRVARGWPALSQRAVARKVGVSTVAYVQWERGTREVLITRLPALAEALGVTVVDLVTWSVSDLPAKVCPRCSNGLPICADETPSGARVQPRHDVRAVRLG